MSDKEITEILREAFLSGDAPPLTGEEAEALLSAPVPAESSPADAVKARERFVCKLLAELHGGPVRLVGRGVPFGAWVKRARENAYLTQGDIGEAVGEDAAFVARLESGETPPWEVEPAAMVQIVVLFRLHHDAVKRLMAASLSEQQNRPASDSSSRDSHSPSSDLMAAMTDLSERLPAGRRGRPRRPWPDEEIDRYVGELRALLEERGAHELLAQE